MNILSLCIPLPAYLGENISVVVVKYHPNRILSVPIDANLLGREKNHWREIQCANVSRGCVYDWEQPVSNTRQSNDKITYTNTHISSLMFDGFNIKLYHCNQLFIANNIM